MKCAHFAGGNLKRRTIFLQPAGTRGASGLSLLIGSPGHSLGRSASSAGVWWRMMATSNGVPSKVLRSLLLLVNWEVWKERNARTFARKELSAVVLFQKIKDAANS
jgi:hypothetical protein